MANHHLRIPTIHSNPTHHPSPRPDSSSPSQAFSSPFGKIDGLDKDDYREAAYEIFFTSCRSSPGFGGRSAITYYNPSSLSGEGGEGGGGSAPSSPVKAHGVGMAVTSRVKRSLGLKMVTNRRSPSSRRTSSCGANPLSPSGSSPRMGFTVPQAGMGRVRRPMTSAEIMRQQMRVTEQSDNRLRKTLMRTLVGQVRLPILNDTIRIHSSLTQVS